MAELLAFGVRIIVLGFIIGIAIMSIVAFIGTYLWAKDKIRRKDRGIW